MRADTAGVTGESVCFYSRNLEESIAVTDTYVGATNLPAVLVFLRSGQRDLVSGCAMEDR